MADITNSKTDKPAFTLEQLVAFANANQEKIDRYEAGLKAHPISPLNPNRESRFPEWGVKGNAESTVTLAGR